MRRRTGKTIRLRPRSPSPEPAAVRANEPKKIAVFTAVDGTLLDPCTYEPGVNAGVTRRLHSAGIAVIPVTVMTLDEIEPVARALELREPMIVEAGGAIARWSLGQWVVESCGPDADTMLDVVREIEDRSGANLLVYSVLPDAEAARLSGRSGEMLRRSMRRRFSEPFVLESGDIAEVRRAASSLGFSVRRGRRFFHLCRSCDEGEAFLRLRAELRCEIAIAVGASPIDAEFLRRAEIPIVLPQPNGEPDPELLANVPNALIAPAPAPEGWAAAISSACAELLDGGQRKQRYSLG